MAGKTEKAAWGGALDTFGKMFARVKANPEPAMLLVGAYLVLMFVGMSTVGTKSVYGPSGFGGLFSLVFLLAMPTYGLALARGKHITIKEFLQFDAKKYFSLLGAGILYALAVAGSLILFVIPAIWVIAWFALYQMIIVDKGVGPVEALKESKRLIGNHKGKVWGIIGATIVLVIATSLLAVVPVIGVLLRDVATVVVSILTTAAMASLYRWAR